MKAGAFTERFWALMENRQVVNTAWLAVAAAAIFAAANAVEDSLMPRFDPHRKAEIIDRYRPQPGSFALVLRECGFPASLTESEDGCLTEERAVTRRDYMTAWPDDMVRPDQLQKP